MERLGSDLDLDTDMSGLIRTFNKATGTPNTYTGGYHDAITRALLSVARLAGAGSEAAGL